VRRLPKLVSGVSITRSSVTIHEQLIRQIMALFDEYQSKENASTSLRHEGERRQGF